MRHDLANPCVVSCVSYMLSLLRKYMENADIANLPIICKGLTLCLSLFQQEERRFDSPKRLC
jgi:hypothetical protein